MSYSENGIIIPTGRVNGEVQVLCPKCSHTRKKKHDKCLSVNLNKHVWHCNHCGWKGAVKEEKYIMPEKKYDLPKWKNKTDLSEKLVKWFEGRRISQKTLLDARITEGVEYMPQKQKECNTAQFNYVFDGVLINVKYRTADKCFKMYKNAKLLPYNLDALKDQKECYIVEGEMDCLSFLEAGIKNCISVPNGANLNNNNLEYLDEYTDLFIQMDKIHLAVDNDIAGRKLRDDLADRFGKYKCNWIDWGPYKDANETLMSEGISGIIEHIAKPVEFPLVGTFSVADYNYEIFDLYHNGLDKGIDLGIKGFDLRIVKGYITTITGIPSHGKSEWVDNMTLHARINANWRGGFYSPENKPTQLHFSKMARKLVGKHWDGDNRMTIKEVEEARDFLHNYFWFHKPVKDFNLTTILNMNRDLQQKHGLDFIVIDAWNKLEHRGKQDTDYVGRCLDELAMFCEETNIHCFLVAHPTKMPKNDDGTYQVPTLYNIMGSSNFYNKTDNGVCVHRDFEKKTATIYTQKIKFDHWGTEGFSEYLFDVDSKRYYQNLNDKTNWITRKPYFQPMENNVNFFEVDKEESPF